MSTVAIRGKITTAFVAWANSKNIPVSRQGMSFDKPADFGTYFELHINPAKTRVASLDGTRKTYSGDVIINVWVKEGMGAGVAEAFAEEIAALFPVLPKTTYDPVSIEDIPSIKRPIPDDSGYYITPVCFSYRAEY